MPAPAPDPAPDPEPGAAEGPEHCQATPLAEPERPAEAAELPEALCHLLLLGAAASAAQLGPAVQSCPEMTPQRMCQSCYSLAQAQRCSGL